MYNNINNDKRSNLRFATSNNIIIIEVELLDKSTGKNVTVRGKVINISKKGLLISLNIKYLEIAQYVNYKIFLTKPNIVFEDTGKVMWGMESGNTMYYGIKLEDLNVSADSNDFYQYMHDNGLIYKK